MPKVTLPPLPTNGSLLLTPAGVTQISDPYVVSSYAQMGPDKDKGLMSTINGRLSIENLADEFEVEQHHVQPEQVALARAESMKHTNTIYGNGVAQQSQDVNYFTLPGCSLRWYQPYATTVSIINWSFFLSYNCWRGIYVDKKGVVYNRGTGTPIFLRCRLDNQVVPASTRRLGQNMFHSISPGAVSRDDQVGPGLNTFAMQQTAALNATSEATVLTDPQRIKVEECDHPHEDAALELLPPGTFTNKFNQTQRGGNPQYVASEMHTARHFDLHHQVALSKGFHEISVEASISEPESEGVYLQNLGSQQSTFATGRGYFELVGKLSLGIRNARVLNLL
jgi:hypothetical protein